MSTPSTPPLSSPDAQPEASLRDRRRELWAVLQVALATVNQGGNTALTLSLQSQVGGLFASGAADLGQIWRTLRYTRSVAPAQGRWVLFLLHLYNEALARGWILPAEEAAALQEAHQQLDPAQAEALITALATRVAEVVAQPEPEAPERPRAKAVQKAQPEAARPAPASPPRAWPRRAAQVGVLVLLLGLTAGAYVVMAGLDETRLDPRRFSSVLPVTQVKLIHDNQIDLTLTDDRFYQMDPAQQEAALQDVLSLLRQPKVDSGILRSQGPGGVKIRFFHIQQGRLVLMGPPST